MSRSNFVHDASLQASPNANIRRVFAEAWAGQDLGASRRPQMLVALLRTQDWLPWLAQAVELLDVVQLARVQRHRRACDRQTLTLAYALHRLMLGAVLGLDPVDVPLRRDERGRPWLAGNAVGTSLSHAGGAVALAIASSGRVGVDIEPISRASVMLEIAARVCHRTEAKTLDAMPEAERAMALLELWVRKEALLKAVGIGLALEMDRFVAPDRSVVRLPGLTEFIGVRLLDAEAPWCVAVAGACDAEIEYGWTGPGAVSRYCRVSLDPRLDAADCIRDAGRTV